MYLIIKEFRFLALRIADFQGVGTKSRIFSLLSFFLSVLYLCTC
jgi:hypothetical protein